MSEHESSGQESGEQPRFDPTAAHHLRPKVRPLRAFPAQVQGKQMMGLTDARQISDKVVLTSPAFQSVLPMLTGEKSVPEIVEEVGHGLEVQTLEAFVAQLDDAGLLDGPVFERLWSKLREEFDASEILPPGPTAAMADQLVVAALGDKATDQDKAEQGPRRLAEALDAWIDEALKDAEDPSFNELPRAIVAPHIDYPRGWMNYAAVWGRMRVVDRPARVVVLGTNHFGFSTGVCGCDKGFESPLGVCNADQDLIRRLRESLGDALFEHRFDHEREHSIELQIPWIQHCLGADENGDFCPIFAALVHDPSVNNGESYDGKGVSIQAFVEALGPAIEAMPGRTLIVCSADLSHAGPAFGDQQTLIGDAAEVEAFRNRVVSHDKEMLELVRRGKPMELVASMAWQQNPTRWCSTGSLVATLMLVKPEAVKMLCYAAAIDPQGLSMVSSSAMTMP